MPYDQRICPATTHRRLMASSQGFCNLLTCNRFTRWPEAIPITNTTTVTVTQAFSVDGYPGSAFPRLLFPTMAVNLNLIYGQIWCHFSGANGMHNSLPPAIKQNGGLFYRQLKCALKHKTTQSRGWRPCYLFCSEFELPSKRTFPL